MSRNSKRANTKVPKKQRDAYNAWRRASGMRDHEAERQVVLLARRKQ